MRHRTPEDQQLGLHRRRRAPRVKEDVHARASVHIEEVPLVCMMGGLEIDIGEGVLHLSDGRRGVGLPQRDGAVLEGGGGD